MQFLTFRTADNRQLSVSASFNDSSHKLFWLREIRNANLRANRLALSAPAKLIFDRKFSTVNWSVSKSKFNKNELECFIFCWSRYWHSFLISFFSTSLSHSRRDRIGRRLKSDAHLTALVSLVSGRRFLLSLGHEHVCYWLEEKIVKALNCFFVFLSSRPVQFSFSLFIHTFFHITITAISSAEPARVTRVSLVYVKKAKRSLARTKKRKYTNTRARRRGEKKKNFLLFHCLLSSRV